MRVQPAAYASIDDAMRACCHGSMAKKSSKGKASPKVNKVARIRAQAADAPAADLVKTTKAKGIKRTSARIETARSAVKKTKGPVAKRGAKAKAVASKSKPVSKAPELGPDSRHQFVALAMRIGTGEAQRLLDAIVDVQTPVGHR